MNDTPPSAGAVEAAARDAAAAVLDESGDFAAAARAAITVAETVMADAARQPAIAAALSGAACRAGCGDCCHQVVGITPAEEALLEEAVAALDPARRARLRHRAAEAGRRLSALPVGAWQAERVPCPLLEDQACVAHGGRPLPCRAVLSADAAACRRWLAGEQSGIPVVAVQRRVFGLAQAGLAQALAARGVPPGPVSLTEALSMILA